MVGIAFQFPGQGSQAVGMGRAFHESSPAARAVFAEANDALGFDLTRLIFEGPESELQLTANTQPAVLTASVAATAACAEQGLRPTLAAGHSLGEYTAAAAAGALGREDGVRVVSERGRLMSEIQMDGRVFPSNAVLGGRFVLRACIVNFRTEAAEVERLLDVAAELGARLDAEMRAREVAASK